MGKKPFVFGKERSAQDEALEQITSGEFRDAQVKPYYDASSVPGHAELVIARDLAKAGSRLSEDVKQGYYKRFGAEPADLPADLRWIRETGPDGKRSYNADVTKMGYLRDGYRPATVDDLRSVGFGLPPAGEVLPDGSIRREDTRLYIVDGDRARELEKEANEAAGYTPEREATHPGDIWRAVEERERGDPLERHARMNAGAP